MLSGDLGFLHRIHRRVVRVHSSYKSYNFDGRITWQSSSRFHNVRLRVTGETDFQVSDNAKPGVAPPHLVSLGSILNMSPELETLDQLLGGVLSLAVIRNLYPDGDTFRRGVFGLLSSGDVCLMMVDQTILPSRRWRELFVDGTVMNGLGNLNLKITVKGARRIA